MYTDDQSTNGRKVEIHKNLQIFYKSLFTKIARNQIIFSIVLTLTISKERERGDVTNVEAEDEAVPHLVLVTLEG